MNKSANWDPRPLPRLASVRFLRDYRVEVRWDSKTRNGATEQVDLAPLILSKKFYRPLKDNSALLNDVHIDDSGGSIYWGDEELDMSALAIERLADETLTADGLREFLDTYGLTHEAFASQIGYSRRQVENFLSGEQLVPRVVALACIALKSLMSAHNSTPETTTSRAQSVPEQNSAPVTSVASPWRRADAA